MNGNGNQQRTAMDSLGDAARGFGNAVQYVARHPKALVFSALLFTAIEQWNDVTSWEMREGIPDKISDVFKFALTGAAMAFLWNPFRKLVCGCDNKVFQDIAPPQQQLANQPAYSGPSAPYLM